MNNSKLAMDNMEIGIESPVDTTPFLRTKEKTIVETITAIQAIKSSSHWKVLERNVFGGLVESFDRKLRTLRDEKELFYTQGAMSMAIKYADFDKLEEVYQNDLKNVRLQINNQKK